MKRPPFHWSRLAVEHKPYQTISRHLRKIKYIAGQRPNPKQGVCRRLSGTVQKRPLLEGRKAAALAAAVVITNDNLSQKAAVSAPTSYPKQGRSPEKRSRASERPNTMRITPLHP